MANIIIAGNTAVITSAFTKCELEKLKKYAPAKLQLIDEETKKPVFMVDVATKGSVSPMGIVFNASAHDGSNKACLSMEMPADVADVERWVFDNIGTSIVKLNQLEATLGDALAAVAAEEAAVADAISIVGAAADEAAEL